MSTRVSRCALALAVVSSLASLTSRADAPPPSVPFAGEVRRKGDRTPLAGVDVLLDDGTIAATTDGDGRFAFAAVPIGVHAVHLSGAATGRVDTTVELHAGRRTDVVYYVAAEDRGYATTVRTRRLDEHAVEQSLVADEVKHIPGTQGDTLKAVQNLPGVARPPFNGGLMVVWGSAPGDTRTYVDGVYVPTLFHYTGLRSTVNSDVVRSLDFLPGGYGVEFGRGLGGAIQIESRDPRADGYHGFAQIDLIDVSAMIEGPITKDLSFAVAGRISWLNLFLPLFITSDVQASPRYWDYQAILHWRAGPRDDVHLFFFGSNDKLDLVLKDPDPTLTQAFDYHIYYHRGLLRWTHRFAGGATFTLTPSVGYDLPYNLGVSEGALPFARSTDQLEWNLRALARVPLTDTLRLDAGLDYEGTRYALDATQNVAGLLREGDNGGFGGLGGPDASQAVATDHLRLYTNHVAPHATLAIALFGGKLTVAGQLRLEVMSFAGYPGEPRSFTRVAVLPEPRLSLRWQMSDKIALRGALGLFHQAPDSADFSSVFGATNLLPEVGMHAVIGLEVQATSTLRIEAQGFYKDLQDLVVRGDSATGAALDNGGEGRVYGGELLVRQQLWRNLFGWVSYTISRSERRDHGGAWRPFEFDQTHILTVLASYRLPRGFQIGFRFRYSTGNPYTPVSHAYYDANSNSYVPLYGALYSARLPAFHQLDLRVDKTFTFDRWKLLLYLDIENTYAAQSAEAAIWNYDFTQLAYATGLPFLPVIGVRGEY